MPKVVAYSSLNMNDFSVWYGEITSYNASQITVSAGLRTGQYLGHFNYSPYGDVYGQLTGYVQRYGASKEFEVSGISVDAYWTMIQIGNGNAQAVFSYALRAHDTILGSGWADTLRGYAGNDAISGGGGSDVLFGDGGNDVLIGGSGWDILVGGAGSDALAGGLGNDTYSVAAGDTVTEYANSGVDLVYSEVNYSLTANIENLTLTGAAIYGTGNAMNNRIVGNLEDNILRGGAGNDTFFGGQGNDVYWVNGGDTVSENVGSGIDLVYTSIGYALGANVENIMLTGSATIRATGNAMDNRIIGNVAANVLTGGMGNDTINGGAGSDVLIGGAGVDLLYGGIDSSRDVFVFNAVGEIGRGAARDLIFNFRPGIDDVNLSGIDAAWGVGGNQAFRFSGNSPGSNSVWWSAGGSNVIVRGDVNGDSAYDFELVITGVASLSAGDFVL